MTESQRSPGHDRLTRTLDGLRQLQERLTADIAAAEADRSLRSEFGSETSSECGTVQVFSDGNGDLVDISVARDWHQSLDEAELASMILSLVRDSKDAGRDAFDAEKRG